MDQYRYVMTNTQWWARSSHTWGLVCQKQVSMAGIANYTHRHCEVHLSAPVIDVCFKSPYMHGTITWKG